MKKIDLEKLTTESRNQDTLNIDKVSTLDMVKMINNEDKKVAVAVEAELPKIAEAIDEIVKRMHKGGRLIYIGAGTSGRLGVLDASECPPTYGVSEDLVQGVIAGGKEAIFRAKEGAEDSKELAVEDLKNKFLNENDIVAGLAASGRTPYVIGGLEYANKIGALTLAVTCNANSEVAKAAKISIAPVVGPEVVTGSTRLKAGTSQKMALNMISTGSMVGIGKSYQNLMVDVMQTNEKLVSRAENIIIEATGANRETAKKALKESKGKVKTAIIMILLNCNSDEAEIRLEKAEGHVRYALENIN